MKFGFRIPSITKRIAARTSIKACYSPQFRFKGVYRNVLDNRSEVSFV
jgi:hypothetical protein